MSKLIGTTDPKLEAMVAARRITRRTQSPDYLAEYLSRRGRDWEDHVRQREAELLLLSQLERGEFPK